MKTTLSSKGQIVLPAAVRRRLGLEAGAPLEVATEDGRIILTPAVKAPPKPVIRVSPVTGLPVISAGKHTPTLSSDQVRELLTEFP